MQASFLALASENRFIIVFISFPIIIRANHIFVNALFSIFTLIFIFSIFCIQI